MNVNIYTIKKTKLQFLKAILPLLILSYIYVALNLKNSPKGLFLLDIIYLLPVSALFASALNRLKKNREKSSIFLYLSCIFFAVSEFFWAFYDIKYGFEAEKIPIWIELIYLSGYLLAIKYFYGRLIELSSFKANIRQDFLDSLIISSLVTSFIIDYLLRSGNLTTKISLASRIISSIYLLKDIYIILTILTILALTNSIRGKSLENHMLFGFTLMAFADLIYMFLEWKQGYSTGQGIGLICDILWIVSYSVLAVSLSNLESLKKLNFDHVQLNKEEEKLKNAFSIITPSLAGLSILYFGYQAFKFQKNETQFFMYMLLLVFMLTLINIKLIFLAIENTSLFTKSITDPLTNTCNHRFFQQQLTKEIERARRANSTLCLAIIDLDNFSEVNDTLGHLGGDQLLKKIVYVFKKNFRKTDYLCRIGGDEFAIIMPETEDDEALNILKRAQRKLVKSIKAKYQLVTFSAGIASFPIDATQKEDLIKKADKTLYWAKQNGKNQVATYRMLLNSSQKSKKVKTKDQLYIETVKALAAAVDAKDEYTQYHSRRTALLVKEFARKLNLDENTVEMLEIAALIHDVGKIGIPESILFKKEKLTKEEIAKIRTHPLLGAKILTKTSLNRIIPWIAHHHERYDGKGYPDGLKGKMIPLEARILCICDAYEAMRSDRPYRPALSKEEAIEEILKNAGKQFDPELARLFVEMIKDPEHF